MMSIFPNTTPLSHSQINDVSTLTKFCVDQYLKPFEPNVCCQIIIVIKLNESYTSTDSWHALKWSKFLSNYFFSINNVK